MIIRHVIWDLDGTLVDSMPSTILAWELSVEKHRGTKPSFDELEKHFGLPEKEILGNILGPSLMEASYQDYLTFFKNDLKRVTLFQDIEKILTWIPKQGIKQSLFTGRGKDGTEIILSHFKLHSYFDSIVTGDSVEKSKPHPDGIFSACQKVGVTPEKSLMIGDSHLDIEAATKAKSLSFKLVHPVQGLFEILKSKI